MSSTGILVVLNILNERQWELVKKAFWPMLKHGLMYTIPLTLVSFASGVILAMLAALFIINKILRIINRRKISFFRPSSRTTFINSKIRFYHIIHNVINPFYCKESLFTDGREREESNLRPPAYEAGELPLLYSAILYKTSKEIY